MDYLTCGHEQLNAVIGAIQLFFPNEKYKRLESGELSRRYLLSVFENNMVKAGFFVNGEMVAEESVPLEDNDIAHSVKLCIYRMFSKMTGRELPWGILTGIRPAKIVSGLLESGMSGDEATDILCKKYLATPEKAALSLQVALTEQKILEESRLDNYSMYVGIPFCPSRCLYCSFTSYPIEKYEYLVYEYVNRMNLEMDHAAQTFEGKTLETLYIGGGTPTSIDDRSFEELLKSLNEKFDIAGLREFTVEAGRPDTITENKLDIMKRYGVSRISINTQTINDKTLEIIGRKHSAQDFLDAFKLARIKGFDHINIDVILGLDGENCDDVINTFDAICALQPEEITVHTLAIKRASRLKEELTERNLAEADLMEALLGISKSYMDNFAYKPYYMYRQKNMLGNFENVGYGKGNNFGIYNVAIMEEQQSIIAIGAGSVSKFVNNATGRIERSFNLKNIDEYMQRTAEMLQRKDSALNKAFER